VMSLRHRLRRDPFETVDSGARIEQAISQMFSQSQTQTRLAAIK